MARHLSQAVREMNSALRNARISIMSIRQGLEKRGITPIYQQRRQIINNLLTICRLLFFIISLMIFTPLLALSLQFSQFQICSFLLHLQFELIYNFYIKGMKQILSLVYAGIHVYLHLLSHSYIQSPIY